jgi:acetyl esterase/lipase
MSLVSKAFVGICIIIAHTALISAQPRDTSFTLYSAAIKVTNNYPFAKLVIPKLPKGVHQKKDIVYISYGSRKMHLDIYSPAIKKKLFPAVILIHGGGWRSGNRQMETPMALFLASHGYVAATVEYRLSPEALYPAALLDIKAAIKWLRSNSNKYNIDTNKIAVYGCSSGGQLAALIGTANENQDYLKFNPSLPISNKVNYHSSSVQAIIDIDGVLDMTDPNESGKDTIISKPSVGKSWFGFSYKERPDLWKEASAINCININSAPVCFINSSNPRFHAGRDEMISKLNKLNIYSEVHSIADTPHEFWLFHPWFELTSNYIIKFLGRVLSSK